MRNNILRSVLAFGLAILMGTQPFASAFSTSANLLQEKTVSYDFCNENCISVIKYDGAPKIRYFYDSKKQLIRENNAIQNKTILYSYDANGNILNKKIYPFSNEDIIESNSEKTIEYKYNDVGEMISYNDRSITYDKLGNPISYHNGWTFTWENGKLKKASNPDTNIQYFYGKNGRRIKKVVNGETINFNFEDISNITQNDNKSTFKWYIPKDITSPSFNYKGVDYFYIFNAQSDIVGIKDTNGAIVANYVYDSWGKLLSMTDANGNDISNDRNHIAYINPLRYHGYYYDSETKLYYLNYRYYDPETGRFLSKDDKTINNYGLYVYCMNNPINMVDYDGHEAVTLAILAGIGAPEVVLLAAAVSAIMIPMLLTNPGLKKIVDEAINWAVRTFTESGAAIAAQFKQLNQALCNAIANLVKGYNIYLAKQKIPSSMKKPSGDVSTPDTDPDDWEKLKKGNGYKHKKTNWTAKKGPPHGGEHWDVSPPDGRGHADVAPEGKVIRGFRY